MLPPPYMLPMKAPKPPAQLRCAITGKPACYRDPVSGYGYADLEAYKELKQRLQNEKRGIMTGKRTKRPANRAPSIPRDTQPANTVTSALDPTNRGAVQENGLGLMALTMTAGAAAATGSATANPTIVPASASDTTSANISHAADVSSVDPVAASMPIDATGSICQPVSAEAPPPATSHIITHGAAIQSSNPTSASSLSRVSDAAVLPATNLSAHSVAVANDQIAAAASAAGGASTALHTSMIHGSSSSPASAPAALPGEFAVQLCNGVPCSASSPGPAHTHA